NAVTPLGPHTRSAYLPSEGQRCRRPLFRRRARSSAVEHCLDMAGVTGSIPVAPTIAGHNPLSDFYSLYTHEFVRVSCCVPRTRAADAPYNLQETLRLAGEGDRARTAIMVFPELGLSSYSLEDLLLQDALLDQVEESIAKVVEASNTLFPVLVVGAPLRVTGRVYNSAIVIHRGRILGVVPKTYLPNYREFYEKRHFVSGANTVE